MTLKDVKSSATGVHHRPCGFGNEAPDAHLFILQFMKAQGVAPRNRAGFGSKFNERM
jgi:hypothetical protein